MNKTTKFFIATTIILAFAVGFFIGCIFGCPKCCNKTPMCPKSILAEQEFEQHNQNFRNQKFKSKKHNPRFFEHKKEHKPFEFNIEVMDSVLQVTKEQKELLDANKIISDSIFKELRNNKKEVEKELKIALDNENFEEIQKAKQKILIFQEKILDQRIEGVKAFNKILSKEQREKLHTFAKERFNKFKNNKPDVSN